MTFTCDVEGEMFDPKQKSKTNSGFTLIELMIAIAVIGILAVIAIPNFLAYRQKGQIAKAQSELKTIEFAITSLALDTERWPTKSFAGDASLGNEVWDLNAPAAGLTDTDGGFTGWDGPYLLTALKDPWGNNYFFDEDYEIDGTDYTVIGSFGPNRVGPNLYVG